uniref:TIL domain-containing protein n=1 Tax=Anopheles funestus TaxID=62324 RepID=A0A182R6Q8_ANOFN
MKASILLYLVVTFCVAGSFCQIVVNDGEDAFELLTCTNPNEEPNECGPACGDRTCANLRRNNVVCSKQCIPGCYCIGGYVRNSRNVCIPTFMCASVG